LSLGFGRFTKNGLFTILFLFNLEYLQGVMKEPFLEPILRKMRISKVLPILSYKLGIVNEAEIRDHKQYFNKKGLIEIFSKAGFKKIEHKYFQFWMNNFFVAEAETKLLLPLTST
jgi:hypothetical protein